MFSHLLRPPTAVSPRAGEAEGVVLGVAAVLGVPEGAALCVPEGAALGVPEGAAFGVADGAVLGVADGAVLGAVDGAAYGVSEGAVLGALVDCANAAPAMARVAVMLRSLTIMGLSSWNGSGCLAKRIAAAAQPLQRFLERRY
jgi:hypothetical protein